MGKWHKIGLAGLIGVSLTGCGTMDYSSQPQQQQTQEGISANDWGNVLDLFGAFGGFRAAQFAQAGNAVKAANAANSARLATQLGSVAHTAGNIEEQRKLAQMSRPQITQNVNVYQNSQGSQQQSSSPLKPQSVYQNIKPIKADDFYDLTTVLGIEFKQRLKNAGYPRVYLRKDGSEKVLDYAIGERFQQPGDTYYVWFSSERLREKHISGRIIVEFRTSLTNREDDSEESAESSAITILDNSL